MYIERNERKPFRLAEPGMQTGVCTVIADIGTQTTAWKGQEKKKRQIIFSWELPDEKPLDDGRPLTITNTYTNIFGDKAGLVLDIQSWTGGPISDDFQIDSLLGKGCNLNIVAKVVNEKHYRNIAGIAPLKKNEVSPTPKGELMLFDLRNFDQATFDSLPPFIKKKIELSPEYQKIINPDGSENQWNSVTGSEVLDDEIPF